MSSRNGKAKSTGGSGLDRFRAWLVTGPLGRGLAFAIDFGVALREMLRSRRA